MVTVAYPILAPSSLTEVAVSSALTEDALPTDELSCWLDKSRLLPVLNWRLYGKLGAVVWIHEFTGFRIENTALPTEWVKATAVGEIVGSYYHRRWLN